MKKVRQLSQTLAVVGFVLTLLALLFNNSGRTTNLPSDLNQVATSFLFILVLATAFVFAQNKVVEKVGYGLLAVIATSGLSSLIGNGISLDSFSDVLGLLVTITLTVSALSFFIRVVLEYFGYSKGEFPFNSSNKVCILKRWSKLVSSNIITEEDYTEVKRIVLSNELGNRLAVRLDETRELLENNLATPSDLRELIQDIK